ncbi:hypothetical protein SNL152K_2015 [Streptomyces sp. NL15-2K]|nr:hypothetical protein SNL152K_2015 [Streptomyces sp. NL15-2K]
MSRRPSEPASRWAGRWPGMTVPRRHGATSHQQSPCQQNPSFPPNSRSATRRFRRRP